MEVEPGDAHPGWYDPALLPSRTPVSRRRSILIIVIWCAVAAMYMLALACDIELMRWRYWLMPEGPSPVTAEVLVSLRDFGQLVPIAVAVIIVARTDRRRWTIVTAILLAQLVAKIGYDLGKMTITRYRPNAAVERVLTTPPAAVGPRERGRYALSRMTVRETWLGVGWGHHEDGHRSFPSGHSAASFALAAVLAWFYPRLAALFWVLAVGCALSRYFDAMHWMSDCVAGASIGYLSAWLALRPRVWSAPLRFVRLARGDRPNQRIASTR
jgi:membrane-associated phospholipid phosphatase